MWFFVTRVRQLVVKPWKHVSYSIQRPHMCRCLTAVFHPMRDQNDKQTRKTLLIYYNIVQFAVDLSRSNHLSLSDLFNVTFELWHQCTCWTRQVSRTRHQSARPMVHCLMTCAITTSMRGFKSSSMTQCSVLRWNDTHRYLFILHNRMLDKASQNQNKNTSNHSHVGYALCSLPF